MYLSELLLYFLRKLLYKITITLLPSKCIRGGDNLLDTRAALTWWVRATHPIDQVN